MDKVIKTDEAEIWRQFERTANSVVLEQETLTYVQDGSIFQRVSQGPVSLSAVNDDCTQRWKTLMSRKQGGGF